MKDKLVEFHAAAVIELQSAVEWYLERNKTAAFKFAEEIDQAVKLIIDSPRRWPLFEREARKCLLKRFPFAIIYREQPERIQVVAIAHGHRRPGYWHGRG